MGEQRLDTCCPYCECGQSRVLESRKTVFKGKILRIRIRICRYCKKRFHTKEIVDQSIKFPASTERRKPKEEPKQIPTPPPTNINPFL